MKKAYPFDKLTQRLANYTSDLKSLHADDVLCGLETHASMVSLYANDYDAINAAHCAIWSYRYAKEAKRRGLIS